MAGIVDRTGKVVAVPDLDDGPGHDRPAFDVLVLAELNVDVIMRSDRSPQFGQVELRVPSGAITLGSSGAITAAALASLGLRVALCGVLGDDPVGDMVLQMLDDLGVDRSAITRRPARGSGITVVLSRSDGDRALMTFPGTMSDFTVADVPESLLRSSRHVHISSIYLQSGLVPGLPALLSKLDPAVTVSLDPGWDPGSTWTTVEPVLPHLTWFLPNANECVSVAGGGDDPESAARKIATLGPTVVVKLGAGGALMAPSDGGPTVRVQSRAREPVDTTGAGDNFNAGFIASVLGMVLPGGSPEALALGCACGAISTAGIGGTGRLATPSEAAELARSLLGSGAGPTTEHDTTGGAPQDVARPDLEHR